MSPDVFFALARMLYLHPRFKVECAADIPWLDAAVSSALRTRKSHVDDADAERVIFQLSEVGVDLKDVKLADSIMLVEGT